MMDGQPTLPAGTILNEGNIWRFVCKVLGHIREASGVHGRFDSYDLCGRCGMRRTWAQPEWKSMSYNARRSKKKEEK